MKEILNLICAAMLGVGYIQIVSAATTDGTASFGVTFVDPPGNFSARVDAFWITDSANKFIKNLRKDAASEQAYLSYWASVRANATVATVDGYTGATISTWTPVTVTWNCRDTNNVVMPDGTYKFWVEFTDHNGAGWYTTNGISFVKGPTGVTNTYPNAGPYLTAMSVVYKPVAVVHDIAVTGMTPTTVQANTNVTLLVTVTNRTSSAESFSVTLSNATSAAVIGTQAVASLAGNASTNVSFQWNTTGLQGNYSLRATAGPVSGETSTTDNSLTSTVAVQPVVHDIAITGMTPNTAQANTSVTVQVTVTNKTALAESFSVTLSNRTTATVIGTQTISSLAGNRATNVAFVWSTASLQGNYVLVGTAGPVVSETSIADNSFTNTVAVQLVAHDIAVTSLTPSLAPPNTNVAVTVGVANKTVNSESFSVVLSNLTSGSLIGTVPISSLPGNATTNVTFLWSTANLSGNYTLKAVAGPVTSEVAVADNSATNVVTVRAAIHDVAIAGIVAPPLVGTNSSIAITLVATNAGEAVESFGVQLFDDTDARSIGSTYQVNNLAVAAAVNVPFTWNTTGSSIGNHTLRAVALPVAGETAQANNTNTVVVTVRAVNHDIAIASILAPSFVAPNSSATITVTATNAGDTAESFGVQLFDDTIARAIGTQYQVTNLAAATALNVPFTWNTTNTTIGYHTLRAVANPVAGETALANNTNTLQVAVTVGLTNQTFVAKGSSWRYNDQGLDLTQTPWLTPGYYDAVWSQGPAPLGYSSNSQFTNLTTRMSWGPDSTNKYPTYYFRQAFYADALPSSMNLNVRCVDGVVLYLNGVELARFNMPASWIGYADLAAEPVIGTNLYAYVTASVAPTNVVLGANVLAAEVHRADVTGSDLAFDMELTGAVPQTTPTHRVDAVGVSGPASVVLGDQMPVMVTVTNRGNVTETVVVILKNNTTGKIVGTQTLTGVVPGGSATAEFDWGTLGARNGANSLSAYTVVGGVTNLAGAFTSSATLSSGFSTNTVNATASVGGRCTEVATTSGLLLVGAGATMEVYTRTNTSAPVKLGAVRLPGIIQNIAVNGSRAFVACGPAGVQFVDISVPSRPVQRSRFNTSGNAYSVAASEEYVYIADGVAGLRVVNASSLSSPTLVGAYYTPGPARAVAVSESRVYVLDQQAGLLILNASSSRTPSLLGAYTNFDAGQALAVSGSYAYLVDGNNHLAIVNVSTPAAPSLAGSLVLPGVIGQGIAVNNGRVYIGAGGKGLLTIDATTPSAPKIVSTIAVPGEAGDLALASSRLYVADGLAGFQVYSLSNPNQPALQADFPTAVRAADVAIYRNLAYVAAGEAGLRILSLTNVASPVLLSRFTGVTNARAVAVSGTRAYVGDGQYGLKIVEAANPSAPVLLGAYSRTSLGTIRDVGVSGSLVVVSDGRTILLLNASRPSFPVLVGSYQAPAFAYSLAVANSKAYLACGNAGLVILNMSTRSFTPAATLKLPSFTSGVSVSGTSAYVAGPASGWWQVDVSNPSSPIIAQSSSAQGPIFDLAVSGTNITLLSVTNTAITMSPSSPLTPVPAQYFGPLARAVRLAASPAWALIAEDEAGLSLFALPGTDSGDERPTDSKIAPLLRIAGVSGSGSTATVPDITAAATAAPGAALMLAVQPTTNKTALTIRWYSEAGKTYTVYRSTELKAGFKVFKDNIPATPPLNVEIDAMTNAAAFYVIGVR